MALDKNLFTLNLEPSKLEPSAVDLVDPSGTVHYRKQWVPNEAGTYLFSLSEPLSESILATVAAPAATTKEKLIELHNPSATVRLTFKGTLTFKWAFTWEQHDFEWKREACYMIRKPDPPVLVAVTKEPAGKIKTSTVQILDYNLNRFEIEDRKGLEIVLLAGLLTFGDYSEQMRAKPNEATQSLANVPSVAAAPPSLPPKPDGWKEDQIAIIQAKEQRDVNEVVIGEQGGVDEYVQHCMSLLKDDTLLFITLRSLTPSCVSKVVQVAEATKRRQYKDSGYDDDQELHQYVGMSFDEDAGKGNGKGKKGPRVINLDDNPTAPASSYQPPNTLTIHLSKIAMPELEPKTNKQKSSKPGASSSNRQSRTAPEPETSKNAKISKQEKRKSSAAAMASLAPPPQATVPSPNGLRAKFNALASRSASPPLESRTSSESSSRRQSPPQSRSPSLPPQAPPRPGLSPQPPKQPHSRHSKIPSEPLQQPRPHHPLTQQQRPSPPVGPGPQLNSQPPTFRPPRQTPIYPLRPAFAGYTTAYPGQGPLNTPPTNPAYGMYLGYPGAPPPPQPPPTQRASGKGFFSRR